MIISVDIDNILQIASISNTINDLIQQSVNSANKVMSHNDWNCKERVSIDEKIEQCKNKQKKLMEEFANFALGMNKTASAFSEIIALNMQASRDADNSFASIFSIASHDTENATQNTEYSSAYNLVKSITTEDKLINYSLGSADKPITICNFSDMDFFKE